ncbi:MAG: LTA synthase family protein [Gemmatimonadaceae bacterium]
METLPTRARRPAFSPITAAKLGVWYFALLIPTLYFKHSYLSSLAEEGVLAALDARGAGLLGRLARYALLFTTDVVQVLIAVLIVFAVCHLLLRIDIDWLIATTVFVALLVSGGNWLSFEVIGTLLNGENLAIALAWVREHPEMVTNDRAGKLLLVAMAGLLLLAILWSASCFLFARFGVAGRRVPAIARTVGVSVLLAHLLAAIGFAARRDRPGVEPGTYRGYWSATLASLAGSEHWTPYELALPSVALIDSAYRALVFPQPPAMTGRDSAGPRWLANVPAAQRRPRHIVVISLETAPRKYYRLLDDPSLPTFEAMAAHGITSDNHYSTNPATTWAIYSILSGTYSRAGRSLLDYGDFASDGLPAVLGRHGYHTSFLDSYKVDWQSGFHRDHNSRMVRDLGFGDVEDITRDSVARPQGSAYDIVVARERHSLTRALDRIDDAARTRTHAFVFIATILGHFPWNAPPPPSSRAAAASPGAVRLAGIAREMDDLVGELLRGLNRRGLLDSTIVVVTGDHGLRARGEFASLSEDMQFGSVSFNVPFILYAPGLFSAGTRLPYVTSHVDIAPTLLELVGISTDSLLLHGSNMLRSDLRDRTTFMFSNAVRPVDGYYRDGSFFIYNSFTGDARVAHDRAAPPAYSHIARIPEGRASETLSAEIRSTLDRAHRIFDQTAAYQLQRRASEGPRTH